MNRQFWLLLMCLLVPSCISRSCSTCRPEMNGNCCTSTADDYGFCENLIHDTYLEVSENRLVISCDTGTLCINGEVIWKTPSGDTCRFNRGGATVCNRDSSILFTGDFQSGKCDITIIEYNDQIHEGRWSVDVRLEKIYSDQVIIDTDGLRTSEILGISSAVIVIIVIIIMVIILWRCCPNLCSKKPQEPTNTYKPPPPEQDVYETLHRQDRVSTPQTVDDIYVHSQEAIVNPVPTRTAKLIPRQL